MRLAFALLAVLLAVRPAAANHWHDDDRHWKKHARDRDHDDRRVDHLRDGCRFEPHDLKIISEYYAPRDRRLPPGLQKKLRRSGHLPPGWERRLEPLPVVVERQLVPVPSGYRRGVLDGYVVVYDARTQVMVDVALLFGR